MSGPAVLSTPFTDLVGCTVPIQLAPMAGVATPELVAAVIEAGGMGAVGAGAMPAAAVAATLAEIRELTDGPLAVNFLVPMLDLDAVETAAASVAMVDFYHGEPDPDLVARVHSLGSLAGWQVCSPSAARAAADAGCDLVIVRGVEGGGRMYGTEALWSQLPEVLERIGVPVLAAGGLGDGRGMAAALAAGAAGVRMGTRLLASVETAVHPRYREALIASDGSGSVLTDEFRVGWPDEWALARVLHSSLEAARSFDGQVVGEAIVGGEPVPVERFSPPPPLATTSGHVEAMPMYAGESVRFVRSSERAADIIAHIARDAERLLRAWC